MENHLLMRTLERDGKSLKWDRARIEIFESLIRETSFFFAELERSMPNPSPFDEGEALGQCLNGSYDQQQAKSWIVVHLYGHAVRQANAIGILIEQSCIRAGLQLWRSLFEAHVICDFLVKSCKDTPQVYQDYISHSLLRFAIRHKENYNKLRREKRKQPYYDESEICSMIQQFKRKYGSPSNDYSWTKSILGNSTKFRTILDRTESDMKIFYDLSSKEVHPTIGHRFALAGVRLPLPMVPLMPFNDEFKIEQMYLDYLTAKPLAQMTNQVGDTLVLDEPMRQHFASLQALGTDVVGKLAGEMSISD